MLASEFRREEIIQTLIDAGSNILVVDNIGRTALDLVLEKIRNTDRIRYKTIFEKYIRIIRLLGFTGEI